MREKDREIEPVILKKTLDILREYFAPANVDLDAVTVLSEPERRNVLLRITLTSTSESVPKSIILKQSLPQPEDTNDKNADARFYRDWAGIEFASRIQQSERPNTPLFYGSDSEERFILIEDLGHPHISLIDSLAPAVPDNIKAIAALERYITALGRFNAASFGLTDQYETLLKSININATSPHEDLESMSKTLLPQLRTTVKSLDLPLTSAFTDEAQQVLNSIFNPGPFTVLTHGDIALDNVFDHEEPKGLQLIDFEWSSPRNALLDGTYLRMSMPTAWFAKTIPNEVLKPLELIYRNELKKTIPAASDDLAYSTAYTQACAYNVLHEMAHLPHIIEQDALWGSGPVPIDSLWNPDTNSLRSRFLTRLQTFVDVAIEHDTLNTAQPPIVPNLRKMAEDMLAQVKTLWPDTKPLETYPAFNLYPLQSQQTPHQHTETSSDYLSISAPDGSLKQDTDEVTTGSTLDYKAALSHLRHGSGAFSMLNDIDNTVDNPTITPLQITPKKPWE